MNKQTQKQGFLRTIVNNVKGAAIAGTIAIGSLLNIGCSTTPPVVETPTPVEAPKPVTIKTEINYTFENDAARNAFYGELESHASALGITSFPTHIQASLAEKLDADKNDQITGTEVLVLSSANSTKTDLKDVKHTLGTIRADPTYAAMIQTMLNGATNTEKIAMFTKAQEILTSSDANFVTDGERVYGHKRTLALLAKMAEVYTAPATENVAVTVQYKVAGIPRAVFEKEEQTLAEKLGAITAEQTASLATSYDANGDLQLDATEMGAIVTEENPAGLLAERTIDAQYKFDVQAPYKALFAMLVTPTKAKKAYAIANDTTITEAGFGPKRLTALIEALYK